VSLTDSNGYLPLSNLLKKSNSTDAKSITISVSSANNLPDPNNVILATLEKPEKKCIKKKRFPVDTDNTDL
jgi:hypothetical protein